MRRGFGLGLGTGYRLSPGATADVTAPVIVSAILNATGTLLTLLYSEPLDAASTPATSAYTLAGTASTVSAVAVAGNSVTLTLNTAAFATDLILLTYVVPGSGKVRDVAGNNAAALASFNVLNLSTVASAALYVAAEIFDSSAIGQNVIFAADSTNSEITSRSICSNPANGDVYQLFYRNSDAQLVVAKQAGGVGDFVHTVATATVVGITDNHLTISCIVDDTGRLNVWWGYHSNQENYWRAPNPGDTLVTNAGKISPRVSGGGALEANATYPDPVRKADGSVLLFWRTGGSGAGSEVVDKLSGGVWTRINANALDGESTRSFYQNNICIEGSTSKTPGRIHRSFQCREATGPSTAHGLWAMYSDDDGATWSSWNGTLIGAHPKITDLGPAVVEAIPSADTDPTYSFYFGIQGMCVGLDGVPTITMYYGPATASSGGNYGTATGPNTIYAWRCHPTNGVTKKALQGFTAVALGGTCSGASRPKPVWKNNRLYCFYSAIYTTDAALTGHMYCTIAEGESLVGITERTVFTRNAVNNAYCASFVYDTTKWDGGAGTLLANFLKTGLTGFTTPGSSSAAVGVVSFPSSAPSILGLVEIFGSGAMDWFVLGDNATVDGSTNVQTGLDQSGNGHDFAQPTTTKRPAFVAAAVDGKAKWSFDGTDDFLDLTLSRAGAATPYELVFWAAQRGWVSGRRLIDANGATMFAFSASPSFKMNQGTSSNQANLAANTFRHVNMKFTNSTADSLQVGLFTTPVTGIASGTTISGTSVTLGSSAGGASLWSQLDLLGGFAIRRLMTNKERFDVQGFAKLTWPSLT